MNKAERYLNSLGVSIKKIQLPIANASEMDVDQTTPDDGDALTEMDSAQQKILKLDESNAYALTVGSIHQYPQITHYNQSVILQIFGKNRLTKSSWSFDSKIQQSYNVPLSTAIDYYPFDNTFGSKHKSNTKHKWKVRRNGYNIGRRDSFNAKLPRLTRQCGEDEQELVIFRDVPYDINSTISISPILREYQPDIVVFEYGRLPFFDKYIEHKLSFSNLMLPFKRLFAALTPFKGLQIGLGKLFFGITKKFYKSEISSNAFEAALDYVSRKSRKEGAVGVPVGGMVAGDLHHKITDTLRVFNDYLDLFNIATLFHHGLIDDKFVKASTRTKLGDDLGNVIQMRLYPHMTAMNVYRNDMLCCVLNEIDAAKHKKILLISQAMRLKDLLDKLCGKSSVHAWIKSMDDNHILINKLNACQFNIGTTNKKNTHLHKVVQSEYDEEILKCCGYLGHEQTAFLLLPYPLNDLFDDEKDSLNIQSNDIHLKEKVFVEKLKLKIHDIAEQLRHKYN